MDIKHWWDSSTKEERAQVADSCEIKIEYLYQLVIGFRRPSPKLARALEAATSGNLTKEQLRPDIFGEAA